MTIMLLAANPLGELVDIIMWIARSLLLLVGGGGGLIMIVKGKQEENPKLTTEGYMAIGVSAIIFAATFAVASIFK
jgi:predicted tellurium resistance membrane protein TerC